MRRKTWLFVLVAMLALSIGVATASAGNTGNSTNAKLCQKNGWTRLLESDGTSFTSEEACVAYAAQGGTLKTKTKSQIDCESYGGTFSTDPATNLAGIPDIGFVWSCNNAFLSSTANYNAYYSTLNADCQADNPAATLFALGALPGIDYSTCSTELG